MDARPDQEEMEGRKFAAASLPRLFGTNPRSHHKGATACPQVGFELETNSFQFYAIANLDKTLMEQAINKIPGAVGEAKGEELQGLGHPTVTLA